MEIMRSFESSSLDQIDRRILSILTDDGRASVASIARAVGLSPPSVAERVRRLEEAEIIKGYGARINPQAVGLPLAVYLRVRPVPGQLHRVVEILAGLKAVVQCDRVTGEDCFIAKAYVASVDDLERLIDELIPYAMTNSSVIQSSPVEHRLPAFPE